MTELLKKSAHLDEAEGRGHVATRHCSGEHRENHAVCIVYLLNSS
jgi:hypothetical protein